MAGLWLGSRDDWTASIELQLTALERTTGANLSDFQNTARFRWDLPAGVKVQSASGQFMAGVCSARR